MNTALLAACIAVVGIILALAAGWHFGVKTAFATMKNVARQHLNDAEYAEFARLLDMIIEDDGR